MPHKRNTANVNDKIRDCEVLQIAVAVLCDYNKMAHGIQCEHMQVIYTMEKTDFSIILDSKMKISAHRTCRDQLEWEAILEKE